MQPLGESDSAKFNAAVNDPPPSKRPKLNFSSQETASVDEESNVTVILNDHDSIPDPVPQLRSTRAKTFQKILGESQLIVSVDNLLGKSIITRTADYQQPFKEES